MRKIIASQFITLDGVMEAPEKWTNGYLSDPEVVYEILVDLDAGDALLFGRCSYEFFTARWPSRTGEMADKFNTLPKHVVTTSLQKVDWNNSTIIGVRPIEEIKKLKQRPGKNILVFGSHKLVQALIDDNLIDTFKLYVYPLTLGTGKRLFEEGVPAQTLKLVDSKFFATGVVAVTYQPEKNI